MPIASVKNVNSRRRMRNGTFLSSPGGFMRQRSRIEIAVTALLTMLVVAAMPYAQTTRARGAATPQEAVATVKKAIAANDMASVFTMVSPNGLKQLAGDGVTGLLMAMAFSNPDDPMPGAPKPSKAE